MKKVIFIALIAVGLFSSCSMDVEPENNNSTNSRNVVTIPDDLPRIILIGDSRTAQWSTTNQDNIPIDPLPPPYPYDVVPGFFDGYDVDNYGVCGSTTFNWVDSKILGELKNLEPANDGEKRYDIAIISIGGNDCFLYEDVNQSIKNIALLTTQVKKIADRVYLATIPYYSQQGYLVYSYQKGNPFFSTYNYLYNRMYKNIGLMNNMIRSYWRNYADGMIDVAKEMNSFQTMPEVTTAFKHIASPFSGVFLTREYSLDDYNMWDFGIHFSYKGYQKLEETYLKAIPSPDQFINSVE